MTYPDNHSDLFGLAIDMATEEMCMRFSQWHERRADLRKPNPFDSAYFCDRWEFLMGDPDWAFLIMTARLRGE